MSNTKLTKEEHLQLRLLISDLEKASLAFKLSKLALDKYTDKLSTSYEEKGEYVVEKINGDSGIVQRMPVELQKEIVDTCDKHTEAREEE